MYSFIEREKFRRWLIVNQGMDVNATDDSVLSNMTILSGFPGNSYMGQNSVKKPVKVFIEEMNSFTFTSITIHTINDYRIPRLLYKLLLNRLTVIIHLQILFYSSSSFHSYCATQFFTSYSNFYLQRPFKSRGFFLSSLTHRHLNSISLKDHSIFTLFHFISYMTIISIYLTC